MKVELALFYTAAQAFSGVAFSVHFQRQERGYQLKELSVVSFSCEYKRGRIKFNFRPPDDDSMTSAIGQHVSV